MQKEKLGFSLTLSSDLRKANSTLDKTAKMRYDTACTVYLAHGCLSFYLFQINQLLIPFHLSVRQAVSNLNIYAAPCDKRDKLLFTCVK